MSNPNNSTELGGRKELKINLTNDFTAECEFGFLGWGVDGLGKIQKEGSMKIKPDFKDMKTAGKLKPQTKEMIKARNSDTTR